MANLYSIRQNLPPPVLLVMTTPNGQHCETISISGHPVAIGAALIRFANSHGIAPSMVHHSIAQNAA